MKQNYNSTDERILAAFRRFNNVLKKEEFGHHGKARILNLLAEKGPMTQKNIQDEAEITSSSASEILKKMEDHGLISRAVDPKDSRGKIVSLTELGKEKCEGFRAEKQQKAETLFASLSSEEKESMAAMMDKIQADWYEKGLFYGDFKANREARNIK